MVIPFPDPAKPSEAPVRAPDTVAPESPRAEPAAPAGGTGLKLPQRGQREAAPEPGAGEPRGSRSTNPPAPSPQDRDPLPSLKLKPSPTLSPPTRKRDEALPTYVTADRIVGRTADEIVAEGDAELRRLGESVNADKLTYWQDEDEVEAVGNVRLQRDGSTATGPRLRLKIEENVGFFERPEYAIQRPPQPGGRLRTAVTVRGQAERIDFEGENQFRLTNSTYSTCGPGDPDWYARTKDLQLDFDREVGEASNASVIFKGLPIMYAPWLDFPLNEQRKTGLLAPTFGSTNRTGIDVTAPWYWNIAPNRDATIAPRMMSRRGLQLNGEYRYLEPNYSGNARVQYLPEDLVLKKSRSAYSVVHTQNFGGGFAGSLNLNGVSDDTYFTDLGTRIAITSQTYLLRQGVLSYGGGGWWTVAGNVQRYQTLQDPRLPAVGVPYDRLPQLTLLANRPEFYGGTAAAFSGEYVDFSHPTFVLGKRLRLYPQLSLPLQTSAFFLTPKVGYDVTRYAVSRQAADVPDSITRSVPIYSIDSGVFFERDITLTNKDLLQTLEPRLYYLRVPARDQSRIPIFDTGLADLNFTQIFSDNLFVGGDRIADANQLTAAVTSRIIDPATGAELVRGALGQRYYFRDQTVTIPGVPARTSRSPDLLAALSGEVFPRAFVDSGWQYNTDAGRTERLVLAGRYQPEVGKVLNAAYRYRRDVLTDVDLSGQWPLIGKWYGVGRYNFSLRDRRLIEAIAGLEYDGGCWIGRAVMYRFATAFQTASTAFFIQLELNGLSRIGSNPLDILRRSISGYGQISQATADPIFGAQ